MSKSKSSRTKGLRRRVSSSPPQVPAKLLRAPCVDLQISPADLDALVLPAVDSVVSMLQTSAAESMSVSDLQLFTTQEYLLEAMKSTHRSIGGLVGLSDQDLDQTVDALPLTRVQLERCFLALLLVDNPKRWHARYRKNAWKAFAEKFFRDRCVLGHLEPYSSYFASDGAGIASLRAFARQMDVSEDELQTLRSQMMGEKERDPRFREWFIADMPTPGRCINELADAGYKKLAELLYPHYDNLSHFSHGGLVGVMEGAILRADEDKMADTGFDRASFWNSAIMESSLPVSYLALMLVATLLAAGRATDDAIKGKLIAAWRPYISDGLPMGVAVWDAWAAGVLEAVPEE